MCVFPIYFRSFKIFSHLKIKFLPWNRSTYRIFDIPISYSIINPLFIRISDEYTQYISFRDYSKSTWRVRNCEISFSIFAILFLHFLFVTSKNAHPCILFLSQEPFQNHSCDVPTGYSYRRPSSRSCDRPAPPSVFSDRTPSRRAPSTL